MNIIDILEELGYRPGRVSATNGGEYASPCPYCQEGHDRFKSWPDKSNENGYKGGRFWCRRCENRGDAITLLCDLQGLTYKEACEKLRLDPGERSKQAQPRPKRVPLVAKDPSKKWIESATSFITYCHTQLLNEDRFLATLTSRGLTLETILRFKLGFNPAKSFSHYVEWGLPAERKENGEPRRIWLPPGPVIPSFEGGRLVKLKIRNANFEREQEEYNKVKSEGKKPKYTPSKYVVVSGAKKSPSVYGDVSLNICVVLESELDAILLIQEVGDLCFCVALGGVTRLLDIATERLVSDVERLFFCPDYDGAGKESWDRWVDRFPDTERVLTEYGKDPTEAFGYGVNLREWLSKAINKQGVNDD